MFYGVASPLSGFKFEHLEDRDETDSKRVMIKDLSMSFKNFHTSIENKTKQNKTTHTQ